MSTENNLNSQTGLYHLRKALLLGAATLFLVIGLSFAAYWFINGQYWQTTDDAYVGGNNIQLMSQINGQVSRIYADVTNYVTKGQVLVELDKKDAEIALKNAEAQLALTARRVNQYYDNVKQYQAQLLLEKDNLEKAKEDYARREQLRVNRTIAAEDLRHAQIAVNTANDQLNLATQQLAAAVSLVGDTDLYHHPQVKQAQTNLRNAYLNYLRTTIYSPVNGYVAKRSVQVGQQISTANVLMIIVPLDQIWVDANFKESQLKNIRIGQEATMISDAYGSSVVYSGTVMGLSPGTGSAFDLLPPQNATGNWIKVVQRLPVRIKINPKELENHPLQLGLSMTVKIKTDRKVGNVMSTKATNSALYEAVNYDHDLSKVDEIINKIMQENAKNTSLID